MIAGTFGKNVIVNDNDYPTIMVENEHDRCCCCCCCCPAYYCCWTIPCRGMADNGVAAAAIIGPSGGLLLTIAGRDNDDGA